MKMENITKKDFEAFEKVRISGVTNMFAVNMVSILSGLKKPKILFIMNNYGKLNTKFPDVRNKVTEEECDNIEESNYAKETEIARKKAMEI